MLLACSRERALTHWLDSEQWASVLKAAVPSCVPRCAVADRTVIQGPSLLGLVGTNAVGEGRALALGARAPAAVLLGAADAESQSAAKLRAQPPVLTPPRACSEEVGEERGGGCRPTRRLPARGRGRPGAGLCSPRAVPCTLPVCPPPAPWHIPPRAVPAQVGGSPTTSNEGVRLRPAYLGRPVFYQVHLLCPAPGARSLGR